MKQLFIHCDFCKTKVIDINNLLVKTMNDGSIYICQACCDGFENYRDFILKIIEQTP